MRNIKVIFIHHSTGGNLIREGKVRELLKDKNQSIEFWDHSYNLILPKLYKITAKIIPHHTGLSDENGKLTGEDYHIKITNTDPKGYADLFSQEIQNPPNNSFSKIIKSYEVIVFKSCFPVTKIQSDVKLAYYKRCYLIIRNRIDEFPMKLFVMFTPPPLRNELTRPVFAYRARVFSNWLKSEGYIGKRKNIAVFDFFDILAEGDKTKENYSMLKNIYTRFLFFDSHPNMTANQKAAVIFADFLSGVIKKFQKK